MPNEETPILNRFDTLNTCTNEGNNKGKKEERSQEPSDGMFCNKYMLHNNYNDFISDVINLKLYKDSFTSYMMCNSIKFCSGYFLDSFDPINKISHDYLNKDLTNNIPIEYINNDIHDVCLKQAVNQNSTYNVKYFKGMHDAYMISKSLMVN